MTDKQQAWTVALVFADGPVVLNSVVAPNEVAAVAMASVDAGRRIPDSPLASVATQRLEDEFLRQAARIVEGDRPTPQIVPLRSDNLRQTQAVSSQAFCSRHSRFLPCATCASEQSG